ncbi:MAG: hypothetical protein ACRD2X_09510 [Vicinamibacteraceae bacterium]
MLSGIAGRQPRDAIVRVRVNRRVLVGGGAVMMLGMVVVGVVVDVQAGHLPRHGRNRQGEQMGNQAPHSASLCEVLDGFNRLAAR